MSFVSIRKALENRVATIPSAPLIVYENDSYAPVLGTPYLRSKIMFSQSQPAGVGVSAPTLYIGVLMLDMFYPVNAGPRNPEVLMDAIMEHFKKGTLLSGDDVRVWIRYTQRSGALEEVDWYHIPGAVTWYCYV